jgi:hypothetical protein
VNGIEVIRTREQLAKVLAIIIFTADRAEQGEAEAALSDRVLDAICLIGPLDRCRKRLAAYRDAGVDLPILWPAVDVDSARAAIHVFRQ